MRPVLKGGQWKNSEDEVLKAAVMKYGMNNWSRVASLLNRKTARQCRARWYEWLDPFVKKTPWSQHEDEKLLHAVKVFPTQWKTIAPIVGRTAYQCVARYNELLDIAAGGEPVAPEDDPRLPKPGEIDAQPETRPAKADAVDLDDDEREMLAEARARLANTKGKKAKRKAREKQLEQKRRSVMIQRRKEFEDAGISLKPRRSRGSNVDYAQIIPNQMAPIAGAHDVSGEQHLSEEQQASHKRLRDVEVSKERFRQQKLRADERRLLKKIHGQPPTEDPSAASVFSIKQRSALTLPAPHATDAELRMIASAAQERNTSTYFSEELAAGAVTMSSAILAKHDSELGTRVGLSRVTGGVTAMSGATTIGPGPAAGPEVKPINLADLLGDMNLYVGSKFRLQLGIDELEARATAQLEPDVEGQQTKRLEERIKTLARVHRRYQIFTERLPRPFALPHTAEEIVQLIEAGSPAQSIVEAEINMQAARLLLADNLFLSAEECSQIYSSRETSSEDVIKKLKTAFLLHAQQISETKNIDAIARAIAELDEKLEDLVATRNGPPTEVDEVEGDDSDFSEAESSCGPEERLLEVFNSIRSHVPVTSVSDEAEFCVWDEAQGCHRFVRQKDPLIDVALKVEMSNMKKQARAREKSSSKLAKKQTKLTAGYQSRVESAIAVLDRVYAYELDLHRTTVVPQLPKRAEALR